MSETSKEAQAATTRILMHVIPRETSMPPEAVFLIDGHIQLAIDAATKELRAENDKLKAAMDRLWRVADGCIQSRSQDCDACDPSVGQVCHDCRLRDAVSECRFLTKALK